MGARMRIAVVDDDPGMRTAVAGLIGSIGHEARCFASAIDYLDDAQRALNDCAILDIRMPGMSGLDLLDALNAAGSAPPVIVLSACADEVARARASAAGARCVLDKPVDDDVLIACIEGALGKAE